jgi:hypothetical protein
MVTYEITARVRANLCDAYEKYMTERTFRTFSRPVRLRARASAGHHPALSNSLRGHTVASRSIVT